MCRYTLKTQWMPARLYTKILPASFPTKVLMLLIAEFLEPGVLFCTEINFYICLVHKKGNINIGKFDSLGYTSINYGRYIHSVKKLLLLKIISTAVIKPRLPQGSGVQENALLSQFSCKHYTVQHGWLIPWSPTTNVSKSQIVPWDEMMMHYCLGLFQNLQT